MEEKSKIDQIRDSAGMMEVGSKADGGILDMIVIGKRMVAVKEKSIYEITSADQVDPKRTSENIPKMIQRLIIDKGPDSDIVAKCFLTAKSLFQKGSFNNNDIDNILNLCLEAMHEFSTLESEIAKYQEKEDEVIAKYNESNKSQENYIIPSISDIETRAKTIFQKSDQIVQILIDIIKIFYPKKKNKDLPPIEQLLEEFKSKFGPEHSYSKYIETNLAFFCHIRLIRNGLEHRQNFVKITDFEVQADSNISTPTIQLTKSDCKLDRIQLNRYLFDVMSAFPVIFESFLIMIADANIKKGPLQFRVREMPIDERRYEKVKYALWSPIGTNGYFNRN